MSDRSSVLRKRALRRLAREENAAYARIYEDIRPGESSRFCARGKSWTRLRHEYPDRYLELYAEEQVSPESEIPPDIRSRSWQRASARLADLREDRWQASYDRFIALGLNERVAYDRAVAVLRNEEEDLFGRLLAYEYRLWAFETAFRPRPA